MQHHGVMHNGPAEFGGRGQACEAACSIWAGRGWAGLWAGRGGGPVRGPPQASHLPAFQPGAPRAPLPT